MPTNDITTFDPNKYLSLPRMNVASTIRLATILIALRPEDTWLVVDNAAEHLAALCTEARALRVARLDSEGRYTRGDVRFDAFTDGLWLLLRERLSGWARYLGEGRARLAEDEELDLDLEQLEARATQALALRDKLFSTGIVLSRTNYVDQAEATRMMLDLIATNELEDTLIELTGPELLPLLQAAQRRYEAMVHERLSTVRNEALGNLNTLRTQLNRAILLYVTAMLSTLSMEEPNSIEAVEAALLPIVNIRLGRRPSQGTNASVEALDGELGAELEVEPSANTDEVPLVAMG